MASETLFDTGDLVEVKSDGKVIGNGIVTSSSDDTNGRAAVRIEFVDKDLKFFPFSAGTSEEFVMADKRTMRTWKRVFPDPFDRKVTCCSSRESLYEIRIKKAALAL